MLTAASMFKLLQQGTIKHLMVTSTPGKGMVASVKDALPEIEDDLLLETVYSPQDLVNFLKKHNGKTVLIDSGAFFMTAESDLKRTCQYILCDAIAGRIQYYGGTAKEDFQYTGKFVITTLRPEYIMQPLLDRIVHMSW